MKIIPLAAASFVLAACSTAPFSYSEDRCLGEHNQCQTACTGIDNGSARAACIERCYDNENRCYASGPSGDGSSLATDRAIAAARSQAEKEAAYEEWRAARQREKAASGESDVDIVVLEKE